MSKVKWNEQDCGEMPLLASEKINQLKQELNILTIFLESLGKRFGIIKGWQIEHAAKELCRQSIRDIDRYLNKENL